MGFNPVSHVADRGPPISFIISQSALAWARHTLIEFMFTEIQLIDGHIKDDYQASLVAQWLRIRLLMQGTRVQALVWEDPTCCGAAKPVCHNY